MLNTEIWLPITSSLFTITSYLTKISPADFCWWAQVDSNHRPHAYQACALTTWAMSPYLVEISGIEPLTPCLQSRCSPSWAIPPYLLLWKTYAFSGSGLSKLNNASSRFRNSDLGFNVLFIHRFSIERRWSSRTFRYGYLVTTSPQSPILPSTASSLRLNYWLRVLPAPMVWRAVCTRPGNVFTAACWSAITSNSDFI